METFAIQDNIYELFTSDTELMDRLGKPSDDKSKNLRCRREEINLNELKPEIVPFVSFVFIDSLKSDNYLRNNGILELNIFCSDRFQAIGIYDRCILLLEQKFEIQVFREGQVNSDISGIYCYRTKFKILVNS